MATFRVKQSWTDAWHVETHEVEADSVEAACQAAAEQAGDSDHWFTNCEPGPTIVDEVETVLDPDDAVTHPVPVAFQDQSAVGWQLADRLALLLAHVTREAGDRLTVQTVTAVRDLLLQAPKAVSDSG